MTDEMTEFLVAARLQDPSTFAMILTQSPIEIVIEQLRKLGIHEKDFMVAKVTPHEVPRYLRAADIAISFIKPCYSKQSSSPTKIAEYLASGLPVVCNSGVGDLDKLINENQVGVLLTQFTEEAYLQALIDIDSLRGETAFAEHASQVARREFDLDTTGGTRYTRLYRRLARTDAQPAGSISRQTISSELR